MASSEHTPETGARFLLELPAAVADGETRAIYRAAIFTPDHAFEGTATLGDDGAVELAVEAPEQLVAKLTMFARLLARGVGKRREDGMPAWPQRVLRWRGDA